ncbi:hypothetical protein HOB94_00590 [bacterium]|nr:hypothetical protein [bacterium]MBT6778685.1 hypothetical protein [bacterium]
MSSLKLTKYLSLFKYTSVHTFTQNKPAVYEKKVYFFNILIKNFFVSIISSFVSVGNQKIV